MYLDIIEIQPKGILPIVPSVPVTFNCTKKIEGVLLGWRVHLTNGSLFFIANDSTFFYNINFTATLVDTYVTSLEFEFDTILASVECQFTNGSGKIIRSDRTYFLVVSKLIGFCVLSCCHFNLNALNGL